MASGREILLKSARISNPWNGVPWEGVKTEDGEVLARCLSANKIPLCALQKKFGAEIVSAHFGRRLPDEIEAAEKMRNEFERVRTAFIDREIRTVLIKSTGLYPAFPYWSSNLDVLVSPGRGDDARKLLHKLGYAELLNTEEPSKFLFRRFGGDGFHYTFHLHETVGWGVPFVDPESIWRFSRPSPEDPEVIIPGAKESLLITLAHWFYEDKELTLWNMFLTAHALRNLDNPVGAAAADAAKFGWKDGFYAALELFDRAWERLFGEPLNAGGSAETDRRSPERRDFTTRLLMNGAIFSSPVPLKIPFWTNKLVYYKKIFTDPSRSVPTRICDWIKTLLWAVRWKLRIRSQRPFLMVMSGCDGSGKTTQTGLLMRVLRTCDLRNKALWFRGGSSSFIAFFIRQAAGIHAGIKKSGRKNAGGKTGGGTEAERVLRRRDALRNPLLRFFYSVLYSLDMAWTFCIKTRIHLAAGRIVVCDRYIGDAVVDFAVSSAGGVNNPPAALKILERLSPSPDMVFVLDVNERDALERKPDEGETSHIRDSREMFMQLAETKSWHVTSADNSVEEIHETMAKQCLETYYKSYKTVINSLLFSNPGQVNPGRWRPH